MTAIWLEPYGPYDMADMGAKLVYEFDWPFRTDNFKWIFFTIESFSKKN